MTTTSRTTRALRQVEDLVLFAASTLERRRSTADRARGLLDTVSWETLLGEIANQRLVPLLGRRLLELAGAAAPPDFARAVQNQSEAARARGSLMELVTLRIAGALEATGVRNVPLKGPLLARSLHGDVGMRFSHDIDVLVSRAELQRAAAVLASLGWHIDDGEPDPVLHVSLTHEAGLPSVELHWRIHWYEADFGAAALRRAQTGPDGIRRLAATDGLAALLLYHARDGFAGLRHPADVAAWWDAHGRRSARPLMLEIMQAHPDLTRALRASAAVLEELVGVPAGALVKAGAPLPWGARRAAGLVNPLMRGTRQQITAEVSLVDGLLSPAGGRADFLRRRALPSRRELPARLARRPLPAARAEHVLRLTRRYVLALARPRPIARGRSGTNVAGR